MSACSLTRRPGAAGIIRYRALATNSPSLAIARSLGFAGCGQNLIARLPA
jgi:hypothetical protein